jgi:hypothetical protein
MRVLLCSPYSASVQFVQGGIAIWARNVMEYYQTLKTDITIQVVPFDRTVRADARVKESLLKRIWYGISDYSNNHKQNKKGNLLIAF